MDEKSLRKTTPLLLKSAASIAFPDGTITASSLRGMIQKGLLRAELIAGRYFTTIEYIEEMRSKCLVQKVPGSTCGKSVVRNLGGSSNGQSTSFAMEGNISPQDALREKLRKLKRN